MEETPFVSATQFFYLLVCNIEEFHFNFPFTHLFPPLVLVRNLAFMPHPQGR